MKAKRFLLAVLLVFAAFGLLACNAGGSMDADYGSSAPPAESGTGDLNGETVNATSRKIIYRYAGDVYTDDLDGTVQKITGALKEYDDAYIESSEKNKNGGRGYARYVIRIESECLDAFIAAVKTSGEVRGETLTSEDVTKNYLDLEARKDAKEAEVARLFVLYEKAVSIYDIDSLSKRIAEAQAQLNAINASLAEYDSLVTLSTVTLNIYQDTAPPPSDPVDDSFGATLLRVLKGAGTAIAVFFEYLLYAVIYVGPFAIVGLGIAFPVWYQTTKKKRMAAKAAKKEAKEIVETKDADEK